MRFKGFFSRSKKIDAKRELRCFEWYSIFFNRFPNHLSSVHTNRHMAAWHTHDEHEKCYIEHLKRSLSKHNNARDTQMIHPIACYYRQFVYKSILLRRRFFLSAYRSVHMVHTALNHQYIHTYICHAYDGCSTITMHRFHHPPQWKDEITNLLVRRKRLIVLG